MEQLSKVRSIRYKKAVRLNTVTAWAEYREIDKEIRKKARKAQRRCWREFKAELEKDSRSRMTGKVANIIKARR